MVPDFNTIDLCSGNIFQVTWDLGRRCNYDCSYCPVHRHDNFSPHATLESLQKNTDFVFKYVDLYMTYRKYKSASVNFTGGEPTVNPKFVDFCKYVRKTYNKYFADKWFCNFTLTTNGAMGEKTATAVLKNIDHVTISYHAEANEIVKNQVKDRMLQFNKYSLEENCTLSINVMFHANFFDECIDICKFLQDNKIKFVPRIIGEETNSSSAHLYTEEQLDWIRNFWKNK